MDKDHSGFISIAEYKLFFKCLGLTPENAAVSFAVIDKNGDGKLSIKEFVKLGREYFLTENEKRISRMFWGPLANDHWNNTADFPIFDILFLNHPIYRQFTLLYEVPIETMRYWESIWNEFRLYWNGLWALQHHCCKIELILLALNMCSAIYFFNITLSSYHEYCTTYINK